MPDCPVPWNWPAAARTSILLEANRVAWGASGRNAGFVIAGFANGIEHIEKHLGRDAARALFRLSRDGVEICSQSGLADCT